jgi:hypothetical protein
MSNFFTVVLFCCNYVAFLMLVMTKNRNGDNSHMGKEKIKTSYCLFID